MRQRLSRQDGKERTRSDLVAAAREVFMRRGFHGASLEEISEQAGYTKGAVYSNFSGKDELFLAVLDDHAASRARAYGEASTEASSFDGSLRAVVREITGGAQADPRWVPALVEFWSHASRDVALRRDVSARHERNLDFIAGLLRDLAARHGVSFRIPVGEVARGASAHRTGMELERLLDPDGADAATFEAMTLGFIAGMTSQASLEGVAAAPTPASDSEARRA
jgi:AcrR family transcriptional regulator